MAHIEHQVHISATVDQVFEAFTRYAEYPDFMKSVDQVLVDDTEPDLLHWHLSIATVPRIVVTRVRADRAAQRVEWRSEKGIENYGTVTLRTLDDGSTELSMVADYEPEGFLESVGAELGLISQRIEGDLGRFATYVESAGDQAEGRSPVTEVLGSGATPSNRLTERLTPGDS